MQSDCAIFLLKYLKLVACWMLIETDGFVLDAELWKLHLKMIYSVFINLIMLSQYVSYSVQMNQTKSDHEMVVQNGVETDVRLKCER